MTKRKNQSGQILLIVILAMAVITTLVLSVVSRSVSDITVTTRDEDSLRAFSAAEAGVEKALTEGLTPGTRIQETIDTVTNAEVVANVSNFPTNPRAYVYPVDLKSGRIGTVWFMDHDANDNLTCGAGFQCFTGQIINLCWGHNQNYPNPDTIPAVEVSVVYQNLGVMAVAREAYDDNATRRAANSFSAPDTSNGSCSIAGTAFKYSKRLDLAAMGVPTAAYTNTGRLRMLRIRMLYNDDLVQIFGVTSPAVSSPFPSQGRRIESTGTAGQSTRRVEAFRLYPEIPTPFDSAVFSHPAIVK